MKLIEEQALERRERILETVRSCIAQQGVEELTIRELAKACRVSVPTLYRSFGSKEQLLVEAIRSYFNNQVLGDLLEHTGLKGQARLLAIVELCAKTVSEMTSYNRQLFQLYMSSEFGKTLGWDIIDLITGHVEQAIEEIHQSGELHEWVDKHALAERITSQCLVVSLEFFSGVLSIEGYGAAFAYSTSLLMAAATSGTAQEHFQRSIVQSQAASCRKAREATVPVSGTVAGA